MGPETWRMNQQITIADVQLEATILLPNGKRRITDVLLTCSSGTRIAVEIAVTNPKEHEYASQMESVNILAVEHQAKVSDPDQEIPSAQQILSEATWLWEPYSGPLREAMTAKQQHDALLFTEIQIVATHRETQIAASTAKSDPKGSHHLLIGITEQVFELDGHDPYQQSSLNELHSRVLRGLAYTHTRVHEVEIQPFRNLVNTIVPAPRARIRPIRQDKFGSWLRRDTKETLNRRAKRVAQLGFSQSSNRATLFTVRISPWRIYVDFDSTDVRRIWEVDCEPTIYAFPQNRPEHRELGSVDISL